ncbi:hypothetical protein BDZ88DRAFT_433289, partial [Geranomyces variabilis]
METRSRDRQPRTATGQQAKSNVLVAHAHRKWELNCQSQGLASGASRADLQRWVSLFFFVFVFSSSGQPSDDLFSCTVFNPRRGGPCYYPLPFSHKGHIILSHRSAIHVRKQSPLALAISITASIERRWQQPLQLPAAAATANDRAASQQQPGSPLPGGAIRWPSV